MNYDRIRYRKIQLELDTRGAQPPEYYSELYTDGDKEQAAHIVGGSILDRMMGQCLSRR